MIKIKLSGVFVNDQDRAEQFYTEILGFVKKNDIPMGEYRWLTVVSQNTDDFELLLEPNVNPAAKTYQEALFEQKIPATAFEVDDLDVECKRLSKHQVEFETEPMSAGTVKLAVIKDGCGNLIQLYQPMT